jgi:hypothetical protein
MATGIYKLSFPNTNSVYIGQALDIHRRYLAHLRSMKDGSSAKKLQKAYDTFGEPSLEILLETTKEELSSAEAEAIEIYNSIANGFNSILTSTTNRIFQEGQDASNAQYLNEVYISIFNYCVDGILADKEIAEITGSTWQVVGTIRKCENHKWLKNMFPDKYAILENRKKQFINGPHNCAEARGILYDTLISPQNVEYTVKNVREFARQHNLHPSNLSDLLHGKFKSLHGWRLKNSKIKEYPSIISPDNIVYCIPYRGASAFAKQHGILANKLSELLNGKIKEYHGCHIN